MTVIHHISQICIILLCMFQLLRRNVRQSGVLRLTDRCFEPLSTDPDAIRHHRVHTSGNIGPAGRLHTI